MWDEEALERNDPDYFNAERSELKRVNETLEMIPSENFPSRDVLRALGSIFNNKYAEGYPGKRYYGGNVHVDTVENLAIERAKKLFGAEHVNVQPLSGSPANMAIYYALLQPGDTLMGMNLMMGGHLSHGHPVNFSGKMYRSVQYGVDPETHRINYDEVLDLARKEKPKMIISGATAYPRTIDFKRFNEIAEEVGAVSMADIAHIAGLIIGGIHPSPFPFTDVVMTTTHKTLRGPRSAIIMCKERFAKAIDKAVFPGLQGGPHEHVIAAKAVAFREALQPDFRKYAGQVVKNSKTLAKKLKEEGLTLVSGGTDNHLILVDLRPDGITGKEAEEALDQAGITVNKNTIPYDDRKPWDPSGIRLGTPAITTRGMKEKEMERIGEMIAMVIRNPGKDSHLEGIKEEVREFCREFPVY